MHGEQSEASQHPALVFVLWETLGPARPGRLKTTQLEPLSVSTMLRQGQTHGVTSIPTQPSTPSPNIPTHSHPPPWVLPDHGQISCISLFLTAPSCPQLGQNRPFLSSTPALPPLLHLMGPVLAYICPLTRWNPGFSSLSSGTEERPQKRLINS